MDLTNMLKQGSPESVLNAWYESRDMPRTRLGLSEIGNPCKRYMWYRYNGYFSGEKVSGQTLRLFELGNVIEEHLINDLMKAGYLISDRQKEISLSYESIEIFGHIDGIITGVFESDMPHLLEVKTCNDKSFNQLKKYNSYEQWSPKYKGQIQSYLLGTGLKRALVIVYNKNTSEIYSERIYYNKDYAIDLFNDVFIAISSLSVPDRHCPRKDWYEAKFCNLYDKCWSVL